MSDKYHAPRLAVPVNATDHILGPHTAPVTVVQYGDFECPDCKSMYASAQMLVAHFGNRIGFVYRHFPLLEVHHQAELAAEAAETAAAQGRFWQMHAKLFEHQPHFKPGQLRHYAEEIGLDLVRYDAEMGDHIYLQRIQEQIQGAKQSGVRGTPTFFLNGVVQDVSSGFNHLMRHVQMALESLGRR